jgi:hypothetical protein
MPALQAMPDKLQVMGANRLGHFQYKNDKAACNFAWHYKIC